MAPPARHYRTTIAIALWLVPLVAMMTLFLATPTLNLDDLGYGEHVPKIAAIHRLSATLIRALFNEDIGETQLRTYGLTRALQIAQFAVTGKSPLPTYAIMLLLHVFGAGLMYRLFREISGEKLTAAYAAIAWLAAPSILPLLKVEHLYLYLMLPFVPLLLWVLLTLRTPGLAFASGLGLLTLTWWLGESAIIPMAAAVFYLATLKRNPRIFYQGGAALALLALYVAYQIQFVSDPTLPQRVAPALPTAETARAVLPQLWQNARAVIGLKYLDPDVGQVGGIKLFKLGLLYVAGISAMLGAGLAHTRVVTDTARNRHGAILFILIAILSVAMYALFAAFQMGPLAVRYTAAFYGLMPLALIAALAIWVPAPVMRGGAAAIAVLSVAISVGLLARAEVLVSRPNRALLAGFPPGSAIVVKHNGWQVTPEGEVNPSYPGLASSLVNGLPNPMRSAMQTETVLRLYADVQLGTACRLEADGRIAVLFQGVVVKTAPRENVKAVGLASRTDTVLQNLPLDEVCTPSP